MNESHLSLWKLEVFCRVIEERSFSAAARALAISQPTVSSHIAALEKAIGARLFDRVDGEISTTQVGSLLYEESRRVLDQHRRAFQNVLDFLGVVRGTLRIGGSTIPGNYILPRYVRGFRDEHPGIQVDVRCGSSSGVLDRLGAGEFEIAIVGEKPGSEEFRHFAFEEDEIVLAVPRDHPLNGRGAASIEEALAHPHVARQPGSATRALVERALARKGVEFSSAATIACLVDSSEGVRQAVLSGLGVAFLSARAIALELEAGWVSACRVEGLDLTRRFHMVTSVRRTSSPAARSFLNYVRRENPNPRRKR